MKELNKFLRLTALLGALAGIMGWLSDYFLPIAQHYGYNRVYDASVLWSICIGGLIVGLIALALSLILTIAIMITDAVRAKKLKK